MLRLDVCKDRQKLINFFQEEGAYEHKRIEESKLECDIYEGRIKERVKSRLLSKYDKETVDEMEIVSFINMAKRVAKQEASIYKEAPVRRFQGAKDDSNINNWYSLTGVKSKFLKSNRFFKLQNQNVIYVVPKDGRPEIKVLKKHQVHVYMNEGEKVYLLPNYSMTANYMKEEEFKRNTRFTVWSKDYNFIMDGNGELVSNGEEEVDIKNPISPKLPFIDVVYDFEDSYWSGEDSGLAEFTISVNCVFSDILYIMKMQGFAIGAITGADEVLSAIQTQKVGAGRWLKLPTVPSSTGEGDTQADVKFISPSPDLEASLSILESLIYAFLTSRGVDPKSFSLSGDGQSFSSGWERLLSLIEKFEASMEDLDLYRGVEMQYLEIVKAYCIAYSGNNEVLSEEFQVSEASSITATIEYARPEMIETTSERNERINEEVKLGSKSKIQGFMEMRRIEDREEAIEELYKIKDDNEEWDSIFKQEAPKTNQIESEIEEEEEE
ncbi:MAG: hypothetical protein CME63_01515 [Halobacteriovoraceae bacterium]|nr:hypothetical protein [Halobacteriovoraceae bacterium]